MFSRRQFITSLMLYAVQTAGFPGIPKCRADTLKDAHSASDMSIRDYLIKMKHFDRYYNGDICVDNGRSGILSSAVQRLKRLQITVGHGNFALLGFERAMAFARNYPAIGAFPPHETAFLEKVFYEKAERYGFVGYKPLGAITDTIQADTVVKIPGTGQYLYRGLPLNTYRSIKQTLGDSVVLTSGVRGVMKQFLLFLHKAHCNGGNLSLASRQLAPPGYSFHGIGDFDVGQHGFGPANFTERFMTTGVYRRLKDMGYLTLRYPKGNLFGVRFEPWHIKVV